MTAIVLVDGTGHPKSLILEGHAPALIEFTPLPNGQSPRAWKAGAVIFDLQVDTDPDGRPIYRQRGMGTPEIRWHP